MRDKELYAHILGLQKPWQVSDVALSMERKEVKVFLEHDDEAALVCPECGERSGRYDSREREWRHLDTCQFETILVARVPRVRCAEHGVRQVAVPWAEDRSRFTALFEKLVLDWLKEASISAVSEALGVSWDEVDGVLQRGVQRGLARQKPVIATRVGVDETSFQKRHEYVTVVSDLTGDKVLYVADGRGKEALDGYWTKQSPAQLEAIEAVAMDMWYPYVGSTMAHVPGAVTKIAFDRFHVASRLNRAVNEVRRQEHRELAAAGDERLSKTRYLWLFGPKRRGQLSEERQATFEELKRANLRVSRAWAMKEQAHDLWRYRGRTTSKRVWRRWLKWAKASEMKPMLDAAKTVENHLWGIINAAVLRATNATAESLNAKIQNIKRMACGFRNRARFRNAILFHCGGLNVYPEKLALHTNA
jgi:transposase